MEKHRWDIDLYFKSDAELMDEIMELRRAIRYARDQQKDDLCWLDWFRLIELLPEDKKVNIDQLSPEEFLRNCETFESCMRCYLKNPNSSIDEIYEIWQKERPYSYNNSPAKEVENRWAINYFATRYINGEWVVDSRLSIVRSQSYYEAEGKAKRLGLLTFPDNQGWVGHGTICLHIDDILRDIESKDGICFTDTEQYRRNRSK